MFLLIAFIFVDVQLTYVTLDGWFVWFFFPSFFFFSLILLRQNWQIKIVYIEGLQCDGLIYAYIVK